jgi:hypothetical protein
MDGASGRTASGSSNNGGAQVGGAMNGAGGAAAMGGGGVAGQGGTGNGAGGTNADASATGTGGATAGAGGATGVGGNIGDSSVAGSGGSRVTDGGASDARADVRAASDAGTGVAMDGSSGGTGGQVGLPAGVVSLFPAPNAANICADPPLRITFSGPPTLGTAGRIQVFRTAQPGTAVALVDMAIATVSDAVGGTNLNMGRRVFVDGNDAVIYLHSRSLAYGQSYYVTVDSGAIVGPGARPLAITDTTTWRFDTAAAAPTTLATLSVALDGSGQFCSVQGAIDALPANNSVAARINVASGIYHEFIHSRAKNSVTINGQDRKATIIEGTNNDAMNPGTATRSLVGIDATTSLVLQNITIHNLTPQGGTQAEALRLQSCDMCVVRNADILSLQDTLLWEGRIYADNCLIAGNVDFVWGAGTAYFNNCEIRTVVRNGANVMSRNTAATYGYVFVDSRLTADPGIVGQNLARIDATIYPASNVAYLNCQMAGHITRAGWMLTAGTDTSMLRFWEFQSTDPQGNLLDVSGRTVGTQLLAPQAAMVRDPTVVLRGWQPPAN